MNKKIISPITGFRILSLRFFISVLFFASCGNKDAKEEDDAMTRKGTPVKVCVISSGPMEETVSLVATSAFLVKTAVKSPVNGYVKKINAQPGAWVNQGDILFIMKTKEAQNLGNTITKLDTGFHFSGETNIYAPVSGYVTQISDQGGDYVQDGEQLAIIAEGNSFVFQLEVPYEMKKYLPADQTLQLLLPDGRMIPAVIKMAMPTVDAASQTQGYQLKVNTGEMIPENLVAKVTLVKQAKPKTISLLKKSILANETQSVFWVMKLISDTVAVRVDIKKGIEEDDRVEVLSPEFSADEKFLCSGNYGLPDTAKVIIINDK